MTKNNAGKTDKKLLTRREFLIGSGAILAVTAVTACSNKSTSLTTSLATSPTTTGSALSPKYGGTMKIISTSGPAVIGYPPEGVAGAASFTMYCAETLLQGDYQGNIIPWLAESYKVAEDRSAITFNIRKGVKFHDGSDLNADVVKWNLDNMIAAKLESDWDSVAKIDDYTVKVNLNQWLVTVPASFGDAPATTAFIVSKEAFDKKGLDYVRTHPVGTGPFVFKDYSLSVNFNTVKNTNYWVQGRPYLDGLDLILISDPTTASLLMKSGGADVQNSAEPKNAADYIAQGLKVNSFVGGTNVLIPDTANADSPWSKQQVREAVEYAIDREGIAKAFGYGYWQTPYQIPPRGTVIYDPNFPLARKYDLNKAKQLLSDAGVGGGFETTIIASPMIDRNVATSIQTSLAAVGIKVNLDFPEFSKFVAYMNPMGTWQNGAILTAMPNGNGLCLGSLQFAHNLFGKSWARPADFNRHFTTALSGLTPDAKEIKAAFDSLSTVASIIPIYEAISMFAARPEVNATFVGERGDAAPYWNCQNAWLNK